MIQSGFTASHAALCLGGSDGVTLEVFTPVTIWRILGSRVLGRAASVGGTRWHLSPRQLKEVIQVSNRNVGSVASLGALVGSEAHR